MWSRTLEFPQIMTKDSVGSRHGCMVEFETPNPRESVPAGLDYLNLFRMRVSLGLRMRPRWEAGDDIRESFEG